MIEQAGIKITFTENFEPVWKDFQNIIEKDPEFRMALTLKEKTDKRVKKGRQQSAMVRYAIGFYVREQKKKQFLKLGGNPDETA